MYKILFVSLFLVFSCSKRKHTDTVNYNLSGTVLDSDQTTPLAGVTVSFDAYNEGEAAISNAEGVWSIILNNVTPCSECYLHFRYILNNCVSQKSYKVSDEASSDNNVTIENINYNIDDFVEVCSEEPNNDPPATE